MATFDRFERRTGGYIAMVDEADPEQEAAFKRSALVRPTYGRGSGEFCSAASSPHMPKEKEAYISSEADAGASASSSPGGFLHELAEVWKPSIGRLLTGATTRTSAIVLAIQSEMLCVHLLYCGVRCRTAPNDRGSNAYP